MHCNKGQIDQIVCNKRPGSVNIYKKGRLLEVKFSVQK